MEALFLECIVLFNLDVILTQCSGSFQCCAGQMWDETIESCVNCSIGYMGVNCGEICPYPYYGNKCQRKCQCSRENCSFVSGCGVLKTPLVLFSDLTTENTYIDPMSEEIGAVSSTYISSSDLSITNINFNEFPYKVDILFTIAIICCVIAILFLVLTLAICGIQKVVEVKQSPSASTNNDVEDSPYAEIVRPNRETGRPSTSYTALDANFVRHEDG